MSILKSVRRALRNAVVAVVGTSMRIAESTRRDRPIVVYYAWRDFERKARALADVLTRLGFRVEVRHGNSLVQRARTKYSRLLHVGFWNGFYLDFLPKNYVFYNAEPLALPRWKEDTEWTESMRHARTVWGYAENNRDYVAPLSVPFQFVPFGYAEYYEEVYHAGVAGVSIPENVDVLFVGHLTDRRKILMKRIEEAGVRVHCVTFENPLSGAALDQMYARSKIILSVFRSDDADAQVVDFARVDALLSNRRFVIQERPVESARDREFEQFVVTCGFDEIPERCAHFISAADERERVAAEAQRWFRKERAWASVIPVDELKRLATSA